MFDLVTPFGFYSYNCLDSVVVLFNSLIPLCESLVGVNCFCQTLASADLF